MIFAAVRDLDFISLILYRIYRTDSIGNKEHLGTSDVFMGVTALQRNAEIQKFSAVRGTRRAHNFFFYYFLDVKKRTRS